MTEPDLFTWADSRSPPTAIIIDALPKLLAKIRIEQAFVGWPSGSINQALYVSGAGAVAAASDLGGTAKRPVYFPNPAQNLQWLYVNYDSAGSGETIAGLNNITIGADFIYGSTAYPRNCRCGATIGVVSPVYGVLQTFFSTRVPLPLVA